MSLFDIIFGKARPERAKLDSLFSLSTAAVAFETEVGWLPAGRAALVLRPGRSKEYREAEEELRSLLALASEEWGSKVAFEKDSYGYFWLVFEDAEWEDLLALVHMAGQVFTEKGYDPYILAAVFLFREETPSPRRLYLIYNHRRGKFYPFVPRGEKDRDTEEEMRVFALLERELPWEKDVSYWYPLWGCPL